MADDWRPLEELASAVSAVAANKALTPVYQPLYDLASGKVDARIKVGGSPWGIAVAAAK